MRSADDPASSSSRWVFGLLDQLKFDSFLPSDGHRPPSLSVVIVFFLMLDERFFSTEASALVHPRSAAPEVFCLAWKNRKQKAQPSRKEEVLMNGSAHVFSIDVFASRHFVARTARDATASPSSPLPCAFVLPVYP
jgi:hypothetical protein